MSKSEIISMDKFAITPITEDIAEAITEDLGGLDKIPFDVVKIPSGGGLSFEIPTDDPDNPEMVQELIGIIVHQHAVNAYWRDEYTGGSQMPDCSSMDGKVGIVTGSGEVCDCANCQYNQFGSDPKGGNGKACKNGMRVYILREGDMLPLILSIPPTSIKPFKTDYIAKRIVLKGKRPFGVVTKFKLTRDKNDSGIPYSKVSCSLVGDLTEEQKEKLQQTISLVKTIATTINFTPDDVMTKGFHDPLAIDCDDDGEFPFGNDVEQ